MGNSIILFELNEVPYRIIDEFCIWRPRSSFARYLPQCRQYESHTEDRSSALSVENLAQPPPRR